MKKLTYLSVCSGIEAATVAWSKLGWKPLGFSEIDKFASAVLQHHYPNVPNLGDMTNYKEWHINESVDVIIGGTPCQSFSIAGLRGGLEDSRGNLTLTFVKILEHFKPKWFIWENVPGVFSSNNGRDFHSFTEGLQAIGYGIGWRVLDAQYFGLAQRRKRVFVVGNNSGNLSSIADDLFERESLFRNLEESRQKRKGSTKKTGKRSTEYDQRKKGVSAFDMQRISEYGNGEKSSTLKHRDYKDHTDLVVSSAVVYEAHAQDARYREQDVAPTIQARHSNMTNTPIVHTTVYENHPSDSRVKDMGDVCQTVTAKWGMGGGNTPFVYDSSGKPPTLTATNDKQLIHHDEPKIFQQNQREEVRYTGEDGSISGALCANLQTNYVHQKAVIRRLTPVECERLQGFPDNYTQIPWRGKENKDCPNGPRYKALGNSMAVPVIRWLGERIGTVNG